MTHSAMGGASTGPAEGQQSNAVDAIEPVPAIEPPAPSGAAAWGVPSAEPTDNAPKAKRTLPWRPLALGALAGAAVMGLVALFAAPPTADALARSAAAGKLAAAAESCTSSSLELGSDHRMVAVDSSGENDSSATLAVLCMNDELGAPDLINDSMSATSSNHGRVQQGWGNFSVSWSYHPENGLDVYYSVAR